MVVAWHARAALTGGANDRRGGTRPIFPAAPHVGGSSRALLFERLNDPKNAR
jgi:hypothetical protein